MRHVRRIMFYVGLDLVLLAGFALLLVGICRAFGTRPLSFGHGSTFLPLAVMAALIVAPLLHRRRLASATYPWSTLRDWSPLFFMMVVYDNFHDLTHVVRPEVLDGVLRQADELLFTVEPTLWLQHLVRPWLTEYLSVTYALLFLFPIVLLTSLYLSGRFFAFRELALALSLAFYLGLLGYMLVPAVGPRFAMSHEFTVPLRGYWFTARAAGAWQALERVDRDCFPSLHTALSTIALVYFKRNRLKWAFYFCLPLVVSLWFSTVYLRYHYAVDVLAGWLLAAACCTAAPALMRWYYSERRSLPVRSARI